MATQPNSRSILPLLVENQRRAGTTPRAPAAGDRWGFFILCKDRFQYTIQTVASLDSEPGFDLFWIDSSQTPEGRALPYTYKPRHARLREIYSDLRGPELAAHFGLPIPTAATGVGGAVAALCARFGIERLLELGYDYIGIVENDMVFRPGWFAHLKRAMTQAAGDGLAVGYADVRTFAGRLIEMRSGYGIYYNCGTTAVFTRAAAKAMAEGYGKPFRNGHEWLNFFQQQWGLDLRARHSPGFAPEIAHLEAFESQRLSEDWWCCPRLFTMGLSCIGSIPAYCYDLEFNPELVMRAPYAQPHRSGQGLQAPVAGGGGQ